MSVNLINISLTLAGLILVVMFYWPFLKHLTSKPLQFIIYLACWLITLVFITSVIDYLLFSEIEKNKTFESDHWDLEA